MKADKILDVDKFDQIAKFLSQTGEQKLLEKPEEVEKTVAIIASLIQEGFKKKLQAVIENAKSAHRGEEQITTFLDTVARRIEEPDLTSSAVQFDLRECLVNDDRIEMDFPIRTAALVDEPFCSLAKLLYADHYHAALSKAKIYTQHTIEVTENELQYVVSQLEELERMDAAVMQGAHGRWRDTKIARHISLTEAKPNLEKRHVELTEKIESCRVLIADIEALNFDDINYIDCAEKLLQKCEPSHKAEAITSAEFLHNLLQFSVVIKRAKEVREAIAKVSPQVLHKKRIIRWSQAIGGLGLLGLGIAHFLPEDKKSPPMAAKHSATATTGTAAKERLTAGQHSQILEALKSQPVDVELKMIVTGGKTTVVSNIQIKPSLLSLPYVRSVRVVWDIPEAQEMTLGRYDKKSPKDTFTVEGKPLGEFRKLLHRYPWKVIVQHEVHDPTQLYAAPVFHEIAAGTKAVGINTSDHFLTEILLLGDQIPGSMGEYLLQMTNALNANEPEIERTRQEIKNALNQKSLTIVLYAEKGILKTILRPYGPISNLNYIKRIRVFAEDESTGLQSGSSEFGPDRGVMGEMYDKENHVYTWTVKDAKRLLDADEKRSLVLGGYIRWNVGQTSLTMRAPHVKLEITPQAAEILVRNE